ncbi:MAG: signal protein, partial [Treponema sp.]|nr:signal protein [Treponema sp.]
MRKLFKGLILFALISFSSVFAVLAVEYWEAPELLTNQEGRFPVSAYSERLAAIAWQEVTPITNPGSEIARSINIHLAVKESDGTWEQRGAVAGPFAFSGRLDQQPPITSIVVDNMDRIIIAAAAGGMETEILISEDNGLNFQRHRIHMGAEEAVVPRLFVRADGGYLLFVTRGTEQYLSIFYSRSDDGISWSSFEAFAPENPMSFNFHPTHASVGNRDIVFFQSLTPEAGLVSVF